MLQWFVSTIIGLLYDHVAKPIISSSFPCVFVLWFKLLFHFCITTCVHIMQYVHIQIFSKYRKRDSEESLLTFVNLFPIFSTLKNCLLVIKINMCFFNELTWMGLKNKKKSVFQVTDLKF